MICFMFVLGVLWYEFVLDFVKKEFGLIVCEKLKMK